MGQFGSSVFLGAALEWRAHGGMPAPKREVQIGTSGDVYRYSAPGGKYARAALSQLLERIRHWLRDSLDVHAFFNSRLTAMPEELIELVGS
jgi:hypothetical protein